MANLSTLLKSAFQSDIVIESYAADIEHQAKHGRIHHGLKLALNAQYGLSLGDSARDFIKTINPMMVENAPIKHAPLLQLLHAVGALVVDKVKGATLAPLPDKFKPEVMATKKAEAVSKAKATRENKTKPEAVTEAGSSVPHIIELSEVLRFINAASIDNIKTLQNAINERINNEALI